MSSHEPAVPVQAIDKKMWFKRWWVWLFVAVGVAILAGSLLLSKQEPVELTDLLGSSKEEWMSKLGKPDDSWIIRDDEDGYYYMYPSGVTIFGEGRFVTEISLTRDEEGNVSDAYRVLGLMLGSNFQNALEQYTGILGKPNLDLVSPEGERFRMYHDAKEDVILNVLTDDSEQITGLRYVRYPKSDEAHTLDLANYVGNSVPEQQLLRELGVTSTITGNDNNTYYFGPTGKDNWIISDAGNDQIREITLTDGRFFNIGGLRVGDAPEQAAAALGIPVSTAEDTDGAQVDTFEMTASNTLNDCTVEVRSAKGTVISIQATLRSTLADSFQSQIEMEEEAPPPSEPEPVPDTPADLWPSLSLDEQVEFNQYFSEFSSVNFGTSPYIKDSAIRSYSADELIRFAIERNQRFGQGNSYDISADNENELAMHGDLVAEVIAYYFGMDIRHQSIAEYSYKDGFYRWDAYRWAYMDSNLFSQVRQLRDNGDGTWTADIGVYQDLNDYGYFDSEDPDQSKAKSVRYQPEASWSNDLNFAYIGSVKATISPSEEENWILIDYKVESMY